MKKLIYLALVLLLAASCQKDENYEAPEGTYVANLEGAQLTISICVSSGRCSSIEVSDQGQIIGIWSDLNTTGSYPDYTYSREGFSLRAKYLNSDSFNGSLSGALYTKEEGPNLTNCVSVTLDGIVQIFSK